ncbi:hypothetical protein CHS0354_015900 [Potamilus streckersoni]|uniref:Uncharacterized protein n=1 Tax=Potamilus streckersoni TaxID=2493646 RepID=A0AAE0VTT5_9BIVA|nr:hypothetical protein CHS0354_015900 [Potamilus streckersoni]
MPRNRTNVSSKERLNGHAGITVHKHETRGSSSEASGMENSRSLLSKQSDNLTEITDKTDSDFSHTRVRFLLDEHSLVRGYTLIRGKTYLTREDLDNLTFRPQINDKRVINKTYTGEDTYYMALESARLKKGSSELERDNLYRSVQHIPLHKRKNYMLGRPQARQYRYIQDIYGKSEKDKRARQFFEKLEEVQKEDFRKRLEELIEREKLKMETKEKQREQLTYLRQKFEDDAWKRFMTQYVTSRIFAHEHISRHVYGLPEDLDGEPEFEAKLKRKRLIPKIDTDPTTLSKKNKKKYQQLFEVKTGPTWQTNDRPPKLEGIDSVYFEDEDEKGKPHGNRRSVNEILEEAHAMLQMAEEELNDSIPSSQEDTSNTERSYPRRTETKRARQNRSSSPDQYVHRASPKSKKSEEKDPTMGAKIPIAASNSPNRAKGERSGLPYINATHQTHRVTGLENHKSHALPSKERKRNVKIEIPSSSSHSHTYQSASKSIESMKVNNVYDTNQRENDPNLPNIKHIKQQNKGVLKTNDPQPEREVIIPTKTQPIEKTNDYVPRKNEANSRISPTTASKDKQIYSASQKRDKQDRHSPTMSGPKEEIRLTYFKDPVSGVVPILEHDHTKQHPSTTQDSDEDDSSGQKVIIKKIITTKTVTSNQETKPTTNANVHEISGNNSNTGKIQPTVDSNEQSENKSHFNARQQQSTRFNQPTIQHNSRDSRGTVDLKHSLHEDPNTPENDLSDKKTAIKVTATTTKNVPKDSNKGKIIQTVISKVEVKTETKSDNKDNEKLIPLKRIPNKTSADNKNSPKKSESDKLKINKSSIKTRTSEPSRKANNALNAEDSSKEKNDWRVNLDKYLSEPKTGRDRTDERSLLSTKINDDDDDDMSDIFERARRKYNLDIDDDDDD